MFESSVARFKPRERIRTLDWCRVNIQTAEGRPYDHSAYPHFGAPGGPFDAFDCPQYLTITEQFASQVGKTFGSLCCLMKAAACDPGTMMFVSADQKMAVEEIRTKAYPMLEACPALRDHLLPPHRRKQDLIELFDCCRWFVGWSRSNSTLASKAIRYGHANEIDKWEHQSTSTEADPLKLFRDRFKSYPSYKFIVESTPAQKSTSRVERMRLASFNATEWVPCPHCYRYQKLEMERIRWEKMESGKSDKDLARRTAHYVCAHCEKQIDNEHRGQMMRNSVWIPEGCGCDDEKALAAAKRWREPGQPFWKGWASSDWITGYPARDGRDAGYLLPSLYAPVLGWGEIAAEFIDSLTNPQNLRNFVNQWLAQTWETVKHKTTWEQLGEKLISTEKRFICPLWATILTLAVDRQGEGEDRYPWSIVAWGPERRCQVIAYGECDTLGQIETELLGRTYEHADGGEPLRISFGLVDSGFRPDGIYEFCAAMVKKGHQIWPSKGSNTALESDYKQAELGKNTSMPGMFLFHVDTIRSQLWIDKVLHVLQSPKKGTPPEPDKPGDAGCATIHFSSLGEHQDFLEQVINDAAVTELDGRNNARENWERINTNVPNDFRDCWRYAYVAMLIATRGAPIRERRAKPIAKKSAVLSAGVTNSSGGSWL